MEGIVCGFYDEETDYDIPLNPDRAAAVEAFRNFKWENNEGGPANKALFFQAADDNNSSMLISSLEHGKWAVSATAVNRRRFFGPFFKKNTINIFLDLDKSATEALIEIFFTQSREEFTNFLEKSDSDSEALVSSQQIQVLSEKEGLNLKGTS